MSASREKVKVFLNGYIAAQIDFFASVANQSNFAAQEKMFVKLQHAKVEELLLLAQVLANPACNGEVENEIVKQIMFYLELDYLRAKAKFSGAPQKLQAIRAQQKEFSALTTEFSKSTEEFFAIDAQTETQKIYLIQSCEFAHSCLAAADKQFASYYKQAEKILAATNFLPLAELKDCGAAERKFRRQHAKIFPNAKIMSGPEKKPEPKPKQHYSFFPRAETVLVGLVAVAAICAVLLDAETATPKLGRSG